MVALGLNKMHQNQVLHRDIKSDNILSDSSGNVKIADAGLSALLTYERKERHTQNGTILWMSPEIMQGKPYSKEIDVWSYGCYAYELATGKPPFSNLSSDRERFQAVLYFEPEPIGDSWSSDFSDFINMCLIKDSTKRWTIKQLLEHPFLKNMDVSACKMAFMDEYKAFMENGNHLIIP